MKKLILILFISLFVDNYIYPIKACPILVPLQMDDGTMINVRIYGDEYYHYMTTEDGFLIDYNNNGILEYATLDNNFNLILSGVRANNISSRSNKEKQFIIELKNNKTDIFYMRNRVIEKNSYIRKTMNSIPDLGSFPLKGSPKSLVILVNFSNLKFKSESAQQDFTNMLNLHNYSYNGATGSAKDYFRRSSFNQFDPNFVVVGPYDLSNDIAFYGSNVNGGDVKPGNLIIDACKAADGDVNFRDYDENKDGIIDNVFVYYAGYNEAEGGGPNTIWPHRSMIMSEFSFDGVRIYNYACTSEFRGNRGEEMCGIGTFCHEFGHVLSLPDFYSTNYSTHATLEQWDIMDAGSYNNKGNTPPLYSAFERFSLGWLTPKYLNNGFYNINPLAISNNAYIISKDKDYVGSDFSSLKEFFLLENRNSDYNHDGVPADGLLISHIFYNKYNWENNIVNNDPNNMGVEILCASGTTKSPRNNVFPGLKHVTSKKILLRDGTYLDSIYNINKIEDEITFNYGASSKKINILMKNDIDVFDTFYNDSVIQTLKLEFIGVLDSIKIGLVNGSNYKIRLSGSSSKFDKYIYLNCLDSIFVYEIDIKFSPTQDNYFGNIYDNLVVEGKGFYYNVSLQGISRRPIYVIPPTAYEADNVTPYSFDARWSPIYDAKGYYLSVYERIGLDTSYVIKNKYIPIDSLEEGGLLKIDSLKSSTKYFYKVAASDKDDFGFYENITDFSNEIDVKTLYGVGAEDLNLDVSLINDNYVVFIPHPLPNHFLYIYTLGGQCIYELPFESNQLNIPKLVNGNIYILKYAERGKMRRKTKVRKLYYNVLN